MSTFKAISINNYPQFLGKKSTNCLAFALGLVEPVLETSSLYNLNHQLPICDAFLNKVSDFEFEHLPRQITCLDEASDNDYVFMVFDFTEYEVPNPFIRDCSCTLWDFHVLRRELDKTWVHKPGWSENPCEVTNWDDIFQEFGSNYVLFALSEEDAV